MSVNPAARVYSQPSAFDRRGDSALFERTLAASKASPPARDANPDPAAAAQRVLDTGKRPFIKDNYEARMEAFGKELQKGDAAYRSQLMDEILDRDPNALHSWLTSERADTLQRQGHISGEQRSFIAQAISDPQVDAHRIQDLLDGQGLFGHSRSDHMHEVASILSKGDADHVNGVLAALSDDDLRSMASNMAHHGKYGIQGLSESERDTLFKNLAGKADPTQLARVAGAFGHEYGPDVASITSAVAASKSPNDLARFINEATPKLPPWAQTKMWGALYQSPDLGKVSGTVGERLNQFTGADGKPMWKTEDQRNALALMLIQDPSLTPAKFKHDQDMAALAVAAYGRDAALPPGYERVDVNSDPALKGKLSQADFTNQQNGFDAALYRNKETGQYVLAFRGSDEKVDWTKANIPQGIGLESGQYDQAIRLATTLKGVLGDKFADVTGHSLGGGLAATAGMMTHTRTTTFDAAGVNRNTIERAHGTWDASLTTNYHTESEILTAASQAPFLPMPDPVGKEITIGAFGPDGNLLDLKTANVNAGQLHMQDYVLRGMLIG